MFETNTDDALSFCRLAHNSIEQVRKYDGTPYWHHCRNVAEKLKGHTDDKDAICAAYLHDVIEDVTPLMPCIGSLLINKIFGSNVLALVLDLTDISRPEDGNRSLRKNIDREHTANASPLAKLIKCSDLIDNARSIRDHDKDFWKVYKKEVQLLLPCLEVSECVETGLGVSLFDELNSIIK